MMLLTNSELFLPMWVVIS